MVINMNKYDILIVNKKSTCIYYKNNEMIIRSNFNEFKLKVDNEMFKITKEVLLKSNEPIGYEILVKELEVDHDSNKVKQIIKLLLQNKIIMTISNKNREYLSNELFNIFTQVAQNPVECFSKFRENTFYITGKSSTLIDTLSSEFKKYNLLTNHNNRDENNIMISIDEIPTDTYKYKNLYIILTEEAIGAVSISRYVKGISEENKSFINILERNKDIYNIEYNEIFLKILAINVLYYIINDQSNGTKDGIVKKLVITNKLEVYSQDIIIGKPSDTIKIPIIDNSIDENENVLKVNLLQELEIFIKEYSTFIEGASSYEIEDIIQFPISAYSLKFKNDDKIYVNFSNDYINSGVGAIKYLLKEYLEKINDKDAFWIIDFSKNIRIKLMENLIEKYCDEYTLFKLEEESIDLRYKYLIDYIKEYRNISNLEVFIKKLDDFNIFQVMVKVDEEIWSTPFSSNLDEVMDLAIYNLFGLKINSSFEKKIVTPIKYTECVLGDSIETINWRDINKLEKLNKDNKLEMLEYVNNLKRVLVEEAWAYESFLVKSGFVFRKFIFDGVDK